MIAATLLLLCCQGVAPQSAVQPTAQPTPQPAAEAAQQGDPDSKPAPSIRVGAPLSSSPNSRSQATSPGTSQAINGVQFVVNDQVVTRREFIIDLQRHNVPNATEQERDAALRQTFTDRVREILMEQAGRDMGFDQDVVKRCVDDSIKGNIEDAGGIVDLSAELKKQRLDPNELRAIKERQAYRQMWSMSAEGLQAGTSGRVHVDRYVRPGRLWFEYQRAPEAELAPVTVDWQSILISTEAVGSALKAREKAEELIAQARAGEDFTSLAQQNSLSESRTRGGWERGVSLRLVLDGFPEVGEFLRDADPKSVSEPIPIRISGELVGFWILASVSRHESKVEFLDGDAQEALRKRIESSIASYNRDRAVSKLFESAYVWPPEMFGADSRAQAKVQGRAQSGAQNQAENRSEPPAEPKQDAKP